MDIDAVVWRLRFWWVFLPWVRLAYGAGYHMGWHESRLPGMELDDKSAFDDWASRLGEQ